MLVDATQHHTTGSDRSWSPRSRLVHHTPIRPSWRPRPAGPRGPTLRLEYAAGSAAIEKSTIVLDSSHDIHISHARVGDGSKLSPHRRTSLLASLGVRQTCADRAVGGKSVCVLYLQDAELGQTNHMASKPTHGPHHPRRSPTPGRA